MPEGVPYLRREVYKLRKRLSDAETNLQVLQVLVDASVASGLISVDVILDPDFISGDFHIRKAVQLRADVNGQPGWFVWTASGPTHDGVTYIVDSVGTTFKRSSLV
jgi:hypothetical protein